MQQALLIASEYEFNRPKMKLLPIDKQNWGAISVSNILSNPAIQELLTKYAGSKPISFPDNLTDDELDIAVNEFVIKEVTALINRDFLPPSTFKTTFTDEQLTEFLAKEPSLIFLLEHLIGKLQEDPYRETAVRDFLPALVELENIKKPDIKLQCSLNDETFVKIGEWIKSGNESARIIHLNEESDYAHANYLDCRLVEGEPSILWIDSWSIDPLNGHFPLFQKELKSLYPNAILGGVPLKNQSAHHGCPIFALNAAKQAFKPEGNLEAIHLKNIANPKKNRKLEVDDLVPAQYMKHTQSNTRLLAYFEANPSEKRVPINDKCQTLTEYRKEHTHAVASDPTPRMRSIYHKRLDYALELRDALVSMAAEETAKTC